MKPILLHCHIYYTQMWGELKNCIKNVMQYPTELYVTMVEKHEEIEKDILDNFPKAHIEIVEGRGFDVGPFIHVLNKVDLDDFSYIVKLHTKRDLPQNIPPFRGMRSHKWRDNLLFPFRDRETFRRYIENFENFPSVGMQGCYKLFVENDADKIHDKNTYKNCKSFLKEKKFPKIRFQYLAGTMFVVRANLFKYIKKLGFALQDFSPSNRADKCSLAHIFERFFGYAVYVQGYTLRDTLVPKEKEIDFQKKDYPPSLTLLKIKRFMYQKKATSSGYVLIKICKIPVFYRRKHVSTD